MELCDFLSETPDPSAFDRWFAGSKIVNPDGTPMKLYHGTSKDMDFKSFNMTRNGVWFTNDPKEASEYAETNDSQNYKYADGKYVSVHTSSRVIPCYVRATNPISLDTWPPEVNVDNYRRAQGIFCDNLRTQGHDAIIFKNGAVVVALGSPNQIKSAIGNSKFDGAKKGLTETEMLSELSIPESMRDAAKRLKTAGYECLGEGGYGEVFFKAGADYVLKIFSNKDAAYMAFVKLTVANPNKYFPKFHGKLIRVNDNYSAIRMEYLEPCKGDFWYHIKEYINYGYDETEVFMYNDDLATACNLIKGLLAKFSNFGLDMKESNVMRRGSTPVITDPVVGGEPKTF